MVPWRREEGSKVKMKEKKARSRLITEPELMIEGNKLRCMDFVEKARAIEASG